MSHSRVSFPKTIQRPALKLNEPEPRRMSKQESEALWYARFLAGAQTERNTRATGMGGSFRETTGRSVRLVTPSSSAAVSRGQSRGGSRSSRPASREKAFGGTTSRMPAPLIDDMGAESMTVWG